jgi:hypothetical protein
MHFATIYAAHRISLNMKIVINKLKEDNLTNLIRQHARKKKIYINKIKINC